MITEEPVRKSIQAYTENIAAARAWRQVGKSLGVSAEDLSEIGGPGGTPGKASAASTRHKDDHQQVREQARRMLEKWRETNGDNACIEQLLSAVKKLRLNDVAGKISLRYSIDLSSYPSIFIFPVIIQYMYKNKAKQKFLSSASPNTDELLTFFCWQ